MAYSVPDAMNLVLWREWVSGRILAMLPGAEMRRIEFVGPQVGEELTEDGFLALLYAFGGIFIYILVRFTGPSPHVTPPTPQPKPVSQLTANRSSYSVRSKIWVCTH